MFLYQYFHFQAGRKVLKGHYGPEDWQCYHCMSAKISSSDNEDTSDIKKIIISELDEQISKETDQLKETIEEITNQRLVKAQMYIKRFNNYQCHTNIDKTDETMSNWLDLDDKLSIFNSVDFPLKLAPAIESDLL